VLRRPVSPTLCLVITRYGRPLTLKAFGVAWQKLRQAAAEKSQAIDWHFHDLKAKGVADFQGNSSRRAAMRHLRWSLSMSVPPKQSQASAEGQKSIGVLGKSFGSFATVGKAAC
jgi:hypothetical protein